MTLHKRLRQLANALPSDRSAISLTRADLVALLEEEEEPALDSTRDLNIREVAEETRRALSTVRGWLVEGRLRGYKLRNRDWRIPRSALRQFLHEQPASESRKSADTARAEKVDIGAWRKVWRGEMS